MFLPALCRADDRLLLGTAAESQISTMKKGLTEQKAKYSTLANKLALAERDAALSASGKQPPVLLFYSQMLSALLTVMAYLL